jgi:phosphoglucomutase
MQAISDNLDSLSGQKAGPLIVDKAESFSYVDPVDGSESHNQGLIITYQGGANVMLRLSGTGTQGATLRVYLEQYADPSQDHSLDAQIALSDVIKATNALIKIKDFTGRNAPDVIT